MQQVPTSMFFTHNTALGPPFHVIVDTNFINFSIKNKIDIVKGMMDCLLAKCVPVINNVLQRARHTVALIRASSRSHAKADAEAAWRPGRAGED